MDFSIITRNLNTTLLLQRGLEAVGGSLVCGAVAVGARYGLNWLTSPPDGVAPVTHPSIKFVSRRFTNETLLKNAPALLEALNRIAEIASYTASINECVPIIQRMTFHCAQLAYFAEECKQALDPSKYYMKALKVKHKIGQECQLLHYYITSSGVHAIGPESGGGNGKDDDLDPRLSLGAALRARVDNAFKALFVQRNNTMAAIHDAFVYFQKHRAPTVYAERLRKKQRKQLRHKHGHSIHHHKSAFSAFN